MMFSSQLIRKNSIAISLTAMLFGAWPIFATQTTKQQQSSFGLKSISAEEAVFRIQKDLHPKLSKLDKSELGEALTLRLADQPEDYPAVLGTVELREKDVIFKPRFPLAADQDYTARLHIPAKAIDSSIAFKTRKEDSPSTKILAVYPTAEVLPENTLKFYVHFSAPMQKGNIYSHIYIRDQAGKKLELPFLELEQELWSRDSKRLTLLLDPGRIKRGLKPREEMGPIFVPGEKYELVINGKWPDHTGRPLGSDFLKKFRATEMDETQPTILSWRITSPKPDSAQKLSIKFPEPMDSSMLEHVLNVEDSTGKRVSGKTKVADNERVWTFTPAIPWRTGQYNIVVENTLEDLAGNSLEKPFDVDVFRDIPKTDNERYSRIPLSIK